MELTNTTLISGINLFIVIPLLGFLLTLFIPERRERLLSRIALYTTGINLGLTVLYILGWLYQGLPELNLPEFVLYRTENSTFLLDFFFDKITAVYLFVGSFLTFLITLYSRYYLHREKGYKRFFNTILFFFLGYNITVFAGNFETLFIGWEILGLSSFLLIAFYRERYLPVRNAVRVFSVYRIGDVGILLAMWASHHLWHENITFLKLHNYELVHQHLQGHKNVGIFIGMMFLLAAAAKSAQFPFSSWLPRAMEGPTPSSAIFYGSLSVHFGVFLLLRTFPFWEEQLSVRIQLVVMGVVTAVVSTLIARVQSSIKTQIAYSSIAQIGIMFIEIALGWHTLVLFHFAGNAFLRSYQLLVSPSVVSYLIRARLYQNKEEKESRINKLPKRLASTLYVLALKEFKLDALVNKLVFSPLKRIGYKFNFLTTRNLLFYVIPAFFLGCYLLFNEAFIHPYIKAYLPNFFSLIGLIMVLKAFGERKSPRLTWSLLILNNFWIALATSFNEHFNKIHLVIYLSGVVVAGIVGYICLRKLKKLEPRFYSLNKYYGHVYEHKKLAFVFLLACMGLMGFPITPTFIGEDLIFSHIHEEQIFLAFFNALGFIVGGIAVIRIYARLFMGTHCKSYHPTPLKSS